MSETRHQKTLGQTVEDYYASSSLPEAKLRRLMKTRVSRLHWHWIVSGAMAAAAALVVLAFTFGYDGRVSTPGRQVVAEASVPSLVAVQIHADWCARSPAVAPIFADLLTQYGNEPVLFVTLDITDDVRRGQAKLLAESLGIPQAFDEPFESGMIKLIDRDTDVLLASLTGREERSEFTIRLAELLDEVKRNRSGTGT